MNDRFPASFTNMSAVSLARWVHDDAEAVIGLNGQRWAQVIDSAARRALQSEVDSESRATFRETALEAIGLARAAGALPAYYCDRRELRLRTAYMRRGNWGTEWLRAEGEKVVVVFLSAMPVDIDFIEKNSSNWGDVDREILVDLQVAKHLFKYLKAVQSFLGYPGREIADRWLVQAQHLP